MPQILPDLNASSRVLDRLNSMEDELRGLGAQEAVDNLKAVIVDTFEQFELHESVLGPGPARQLAVLREFIKKQEGQIEMEPGDAN